MSSTLAPVVPGSQTGHPNGSNQAAWLDGAAKPLRVAEAPMPSPKPDQLLIKNHALAINPVDWKIQDYGIFIQKWPVILGCDVAGEVVEVGGEVQGFKVGDRVTAHCTSLLESNSAEGGFQLYSAVPAAISSVIPTNITYTQASVLPLGLDTAATGLYDSLDKGCLALVYPSLNPQPSGKTIVVYGGSSSVGTQAIMLAVASGAKVVAVASEHNFEYCRGVGASEVISYKSPTAVDDIVKAVKSTSGDFVGIYDAISLPESYKITVPVLEKLGGGQLPTVLPGPENVPSNVKTGNVFAINPVTHPVWKDFVLPALEKGSLKCLPEPLVVGKGLEKVQEGCDTNKKGVSAKKVVVEL